MLTRNVIIPAALFRKDDWATVGGYKTTMHLGLEDWDFWLSLAKLGRTAHRLDMVVFLYRIHEASMSWVLQKKLGNSLRAHCRIILNHKGTYARNPAALLKLWGIMGRNILYHLLHKELGR